MTLAELTTKFRSIINETDSSNSHFTDAQAATMANEAIRFIITRLEELPIAWSNIVSALGDITIDTDTLLINEAYILNPETSKYDKLEICDFGYLKYVSPTWLSDTADTPRYLARKGTFGVYLYPQPKASYVGQNIQLAGVNFPAAVSVGEALPSLPAHVYDWIPHHMAYSAFQQLGQTDRSVSELVLVQGLIKSTKSITTKFSADNESWRITCDNE